MASRVSLSAGSSSSSEATSSPPRPAPRSAMAVPEVLGTALRPIIQGGAAGGGAAGGTSRPEERAWQTRAGRRPRSPASPPRPATRRRISPTLPTTRPPRTRIPAALHGCCYNCGDDRHISRDCPNETLCVRCGGFRHIARNCVERRSVSPVEAPVRPRLEPAMRQGSPPAGALGRQVEPAPSLGPLVPPPPPPGPPPPGARRVERPWCQVVRDGAAGCAAGPGFSVPFDPVDVPRLDVAVQQPIVEDVGCCYMEEAEDLWHMEEELSKAVVVTITGTRPAVDLAMVAAALHAEFRLGPVDMSIRAFFPEDFLVLCKDKGTRDRMATGAALSFLVPVALVGVPAHAWTRRTANAVLQGLGLVVGVVDSTAKRYDMSSYKVWLRTDRPECIPAQRRLFMEEPRRRRGWSFPRAARTAALWYNIRIVKLAEPVVDEAADPELSPPPSPPASPSDGDGRPDGRDEERQGGVEPRRRGLADGERRDDGGAMGSPPATGCSSAGSVSAVEHSAVQNKGEVGPECGQDDTVDEVGSAAELDRDLTVKSLAPTARGQLGCKEAADRVDGADADRSMSSSCGAREELGACAGGSPPSVTLSRWRGPREQVEQVMQGLEPVVAVQVGPSGGFCMIGSVELSVGPGPELARSDGWTEKARKRSLAGDSCSRAGTAESDDSRDRLDGLGQPDMEGHVVGWDLAWSCTQGGTTPELPLREAGQGQCFGQVEGWDMFQVSLSGCDEPETASVTPCTPRPTDHELVDVQQLCDGMRRSIETILARPETRAHGAQTRRPRKKRMLEATPRRSERIAKHGASKQQQVLIRKLCLAHEGEVISEEALRMYVELFNRPLSEAHIAAVLALFGWESPPTPLLGAPQEETKMQEISASVVQRCLGNKFTNFFYVPAVGTRGGILVAWDELIVRLSNPHYQANSLTAIVKAPGAAEWWLTCVYGPQEDRDKVEFLQELVDIRELHTGPWLVAGDFNLIARQEDKSNDLINRRMLGRFRAKLNRLELKELYLNGRRYTWSNERQRATLEKLDHVFVTNEWDEAFPTCFLSALGTTISDHCPLMLDMNVEVKTHKRFRFESFWVKAPGFMETVQVAWDSTSLASNDYLTLHCKLRATTIALQKWSGRWVGNVKLQIALALEVISRLDVAMESRDLSHAERELRKELKHKLLGLCSLERSIARQRSRLLQLREGDGNTRLFHQQASHRQRKNVLRAIRYNGQIYSGQEEVASAVDAFYGRAFGSCEQRQHTINLDGLNLPQRDLAHLEEPFTVEEVERVIKAMLMDKAPGPDGFTGRFYATCWDIIKVEFMRAMDCMHREDMRGMVAINRSLVSLLPKKEGAIDVGDFRPINLVHGAIKIFEKVLSTRLAVELPNLVGNHQSAFVKGRSLHDNFMLVQGMARRLHALKTSAVLLKLDISKAFDSVQWPFLLEVLQQFGFGHKWRAWICGILATSTTKVMVNGEPGETIYNCKGLRQGDSLSPMLFILTMEPLQRMFEAAALQRVLEPLAAVGMRHRMSIYADDVVLFLKPNRVDLRACRALFALFGEASGLRINMAKSAALPIRCDEVTMEWVNPELGCPVGSFPIKYLGLPLALRKQTTGQLQYLVDNLANRLPKWKAALMPKSGRGFLWCKRTEANGGNCAVAWEVVCAPKWAGDGNRPWSEFTIKVPNASMQLFKAATRVKTGDGNNTLFWEDRWLDGMRVQELAPEVYKRIPHRIRRVASLGQLASSGEWARQVGEALGRTDRKPSQDDILGEWLCSRNADGGTSRKDLHTVMLLVLWELWKHRNAIVFEGDSPSVHRLIHKVKAEAKSWTMAGLIKREMDSFQSRLYRWAMGEG
nr:retrotransposon protein, putative, unclassified [Triticum aestivum]